MYIRRISVGFLVAAFCILPLLSCPASAGKGVEDRGGSKANGPNDTDKKIRALQESIELFRRAIEANQKQLDDQRAVDEQKRKKRQAEIQREKRRLQESMARQQREMKRLDDEAAARRAKREKEEREALGKPVTVQDKNPWGSPATTEAENRRIECLTNAVEEEDFDNCVGGGSGSPSPAAKKAPTWVTVGHDPDTTPADLARNCSVPLENGRFVNRCPYPVSVGYDAICPDHTYRGYGKGTLRPGQISDPVIGWHDRGGSPCEYHTTWRPSN